MNYFTEILHLLSWPLLILVCYLVVSKAVKIYDSKFPENREN